MKKIFLLSFCLISIQAFCQLNTALGDEKAIQAMVARHNEWRKKVGVPPVTWSKEVAAFSQKWATELARRGCKMEHSPNDGEFGNNYGENIYWSMGKNNSPGDVVDSWASEIQYFDEASGTCKGGVCGHYTQLVWKNTTEIGCAMYKCGDTEVWVCNYNPPGNYVGQKPY